MTVLKWWFIFTLSVVGFAAAAWFGFVSRLWAIDETKISFGILALYFGTSGWIGVLTRTAETTYYTAERHVVRGHLDAIEEASDFCMRLAIVGTTLGFAIMVAGAFGAGVAVNAASIAALAKGLSLIYLVTAVGVLCSSLLNWQIVNLRYACRDQA